MRRSDEKVYTCPVHPEVVSDVPGSCPKCGMQLVLQHADKAALKPSNNDRGFGELTWRNDIPLLVTVALIFIALFLATALFVPPSLQESHLNTEKQINSVATPEAPPIALAERRVLFGDDTEAVFRIASGFDISVAAEGLGKARFMAMSPDGRLFVPDMVDYLLSRDGKITVLEDFNEMTHRFETRHTYLSGLRGPNSVAFYTDAAGNDWLYLALTEHLVRYPYRAGDTEPSGEPEVIITFPNTQTPGEVSVVWHITRTIMFAGDRLFVSIGSGCNSCEQPEGELRGMIVSMDPDGDNMRIYAEGLRNSVGLSFANGQLYATENGVDHLGVDAPDEVLYRIDEGVHYGWPYCFESGGEILPDDSSGWTRSFSCTDAPQSLASFEPHAAPLGVTYFEDAVPALARHFLIALHGSFDPSVMSGYRLVRVAESGEQETFMDGFQTASGDRVARPVHALQYDNQSFFLSDDHGGRIYFVYAE